MHKLHLLLQRLADAGLEFVVVGGYAGVIHGSALITNDVDVCAVISLDDLITAKEAVGRERDLLAVKELRAIAAKQAQK